MCNLYANRKTAVEIAQLFGAQMPLPMNAGADVLPGQPGLVVREDAGERIVQQMTWGFPLPQTSKRTGQPIKPKPVNNIANLASSMWRGIAGKPHNRCLIPLTAFAEAVGEPGQKRRAWMSVRGHEVIAWAGMWRPSAEWGDVYSGLMTDANETVRQVHHRMPVLLLPEDHDRWLHGSIEDVEAFQQRVLPADLIGIEFTTTPWVGR